DTEGRFEFDLREHDFPEYGLEFITVSRRFVETTRIMVLRRSELPLELELEVQPGTIAQGIVTDEQGTPLPGVRISAPGVRQQESDSEGRWEVFGIPGFAELRFFKDGYAELFLPVRTDSPQVVEGLEV